MDWELIELAADWQGEERAFFDCCLGMWIDKTEKSYALHDWAEHNPWQAEADTRTKKAKNAAKTRWSNTQERPEHPSSNAPLPSPNRINYSQAKAKVESMTGMRVLNSPFPLTGVSTLCSVKYTN